MQTIAFLVAVVGDLVLYNLWTRVPRPPELLEEVRGEREREERNKNGRGLVRRAWDWLFDEDHPPRSAREIIRPHLGWATVHLFATAGLAFLAFLLAVVCVQPMVGPMPAGLDPLVSQVARSGVMVAGGVLDAVTFDLLSTTLGQDLRPQLPAWQGRAVLWCLYTTETLILVQQLVFAARTLLVVILLNTFNRRTERMLRRDAPADCLDRAVRGLLSAI